MVPPVPERGPDTDVRAVPPVAVCAPPGVAGFGLKVPRVRPRTPRPFGSDNLMAWHSTGPFEDGAAGLLAGALPSETPWEPRLAGLPL